MGKKLVLVVSSEKDKQHPRWNTKWGVGRRFLYLQNGSPRSTSYIFAGYEVQCKPFFLQNGRTSQVFATEWLYMFLVNGSFRVRQLGNALYKMVGPWTRFSQSTRVPPDPKRDSPEFLFFLPSVRNCSATLLFSVKRIRGRTQSYQGQNPARTDWQCQKG